MAATTSLFIYSYLVFPIIALIIGIIAFFIAKKSKLLKNKKFVIYILLTSIIIGLPGLLGFINYYFMPYVYIALQVVYFLCGWWNIKLLDIVEPKIREKYPYIAEFFLLVVIVSIGMAIFSVLFNLTNELQFGIWASTCVIIFILPSIFNQTYQSYLMIPVEIYDIWKYSKELDLSRFESMDYDKLHVMELEIFKSVVDPLSSKIKAKAPDNLEFGIWFQKFITDYNVKFPSTPIEVDYVDNDNMLEVYSWIFYVKPSFFLPRRRIDFTKTIKQNKLSEKYTIIAKRVSEEVTESYLDNNNEIH